MHPISSFFKSDQVQDFIYRMTDKVVECVFKMFHGGFLWLRFNAGIPAFVIYRGFVGGERCGYVALVSGKISATSGQ